MQAPEACTRLKQRRVGDQNENGTNLARKPSAISAGSEQAGVVSDCRSGRFLGDGRVCSVWLDRSCSLTDIAVEMQRFVRPSETVSFHGGKFMSLNKHDLDTFRRAKRQRARKIDLLIILLFLVLAFFLTREHPAPGPGTPGFHQVESKGPVQTETPPPVIARAPH